MGKQAAGGLAGLAHVREEPLGDAEPRDQAVRPEARLDIEELGRARVRCLGEALAGQPVTQQVRDQEEGLRGLQGHALLESEQLEQRVERQELDTGRLVDLLHRNEREGLLHRAGAAAVAMMERVRDQGALPVEQAEIAAPRVDSHAAHAIAAPGELAERGADLAEQAEHVPVEAVGQPDRPVREPARLRQVEPRAVEPSDERPAALGAEIERHAHVTHRRLLEGETTASDRRPRGGAAHLRSTRSDIGAPCGRLVTVETSIGIDDRL